MLIYRKTAHPELDQKSPSKLPARYNGIDAINLD